MAGLDEDVKQRIAKALEATPQLQQIMNQMCLAVEMDSPMLPMAAQFFEAVINQSDSCSGVQQPHISVVPEGGAQPMCGIVVSPKDICDELNNKPLAHLSPQTNTVLSVV